MAEATDVRHTMLVAMLVGGVERPFKIDHNLLPTVAICRNHRHCFLLLRHLTELNTREAFLPPFLAIVLHRIPPDLPQEEHVRLFGVPMGSQDADMAL